MASAEKLAAAANNFSLAAELQFQHREVSALLNRMSEMAACMRSFSQESDLDALLLYSAVVRVFVLYACACKRRAFE